MKYALITGASGGIGSAVAKRLAADGYSLYLHYNQGRDKIEEFMNQLGTEEYIPVQANLAEEDGAEVLWSQIHHPLEAIVYTAGKSVFSLVTDVQNEQLDDMTRLNVTNLYKLVNFALPSMIRVQRGNIIVVSSIWGQIGASCEVLYSMMKGAQNTYVKALAKETAPSGIRVNAIAPGAVETEMMRMFSEEDKQSIAEEIPLGRLAQAEEIANAASFLLSAESSYITGQILGVNGGWHC
ncbi:elongation factor P 5-aminopentanone reductase [Ectobacillus panaciterrae]|uniref:elongation factor P 5-aminopentanone reductase n=1 Tax=Ectobacillus panaciterrae TaxID=363872 RepID=UPI00040CC779|nr:SDR family oxidoreductase [Ectobacillus panaciterrae]